MGYFLALYSVLVTFILVMAVFLKICCCCASYEEKLTYEEKASPRDGPLRMRHGGKKPCFVAMSSMKSDVFHTSLLCGGDIVFCSLVLNQVFHELNNELINSLNIN